MRDTVKVRTERKQHRAIFDCESNSRTGGDSRNSIGKLDSDENDW